MRYPAGCVLLCASSLGAASISATATIAQTTTIRSSERSTDTAPTIVEASANVFDCFPKSSGTRCESSAVALVGDKLLVASDKEAEPPLSHVFWVNVPGGRDIVEVDYVTEGSLVAARKVEEFASVPGTAMVFATTDFDWPISEDSAEPDPYNTLLSWTGDPRTASVIHPVSHLGVVSSRELRTRFASALVDSTYPDGPPYFKVEGMSALPGSALLFGIRETGPDYKNPRYRFVVLRASYSVTESGTVTLSGKFEKIFELEATDPESPMGLSAMVYDRARGGIWFAATHEAPEGQLGHSTRLWWSRWSETAPKTLAPSPVLTQEGVPFELPHKLEGLTVLADGRLFGVCDEDRSPSPVFGTKKVRELHQGIYVVMKTL